MFEVGRLCIKTAGRNAKVYCLVVDRIDENFVMVDGNLKRKRCNVRHLEPLPQVLDIKKGASTAEVHKAMQAAKIAVKKKVKKEKKQAKKPAKKA